MWEKQPCRHQGQWRRRGRRCSRHWSRDSAAAHGEDHGKAGCLPTAHGGPRWSRYPPADFGGPQVRADWCAGRRLWTHGELMLDQGPGGTCGPVNRWVHTGAGLLAGLVTPWGPYAGAVCSWRTASPWKGPLWSSLWRTVSCMRDPMLQ